MGQASTLTAFKRAWPFGLGGAALGAVGGLVSTFLRNGESLNRNTLKVGGIGLLAGGAAGQALGMLYVNKQENLGGLMLTPVGLGVGFGGGYVYSVAVKGHSDPATVISTGVLGILAGGALGIASDSLIAAASRVNNN